MEERLSAVLRWGVPGRSPLAGRDPGSDGLQGILGGDSGRMGCSPCCVPQTPAGIPRQAARPRPEQELPVQELGALSGPTKKSLPSACGAGRTCRGWRGPLDGCSEATPSRTSPCWQLGKPQTSSLNRIFVCSPKRSPPAVFPRAVRQRLAAPRSHKPPGAERIARDRRRQRLPGGQSPSQTLISRPQESSPVLLHPLSQCQGEVRPEPRQAPWFPQGSRAGPQFPGIHAHPLPTLRRWRMPRNACSRSRWTSQPSPQPRQSPDPVSLLVIVCPAPRTLPAHPGTAPGHSPALTVPPRASPPSKGPPRASPVTSARSSHRLPQGNGLEAARERLHTGHGPAPPNAPNAPSAFPELSCTKSSKGFFSFDKPGWAQALHRLPGTQGRSQSTQPAPPVTPKPTVSLELPVLYLRP